MEEITFEDTAHELVRQLEATLGKLAVASEAGLSTSSLEPVAQKLASKIKTLASIFNGHPLYKDVKGSKIYSWNYADLPDKIFMAYATICKQCKDTAMDIFQESEMYFVEIAKNLYANLSDLPVAEIPTFKVKIEGDTIMAVRADLVAKLPKATQKLLKGDDKDD
jgi:hypothetical protein